MAVDELSASLAVELVVRWGADTLAVAHFAVPSAVFVGEGSGCGVALPAELLGAERRCVALGTRGDVCAVLPAGVPAWLTSPGGSRHGFEQRPLQPDPGEFERLLPLRLGQRVHLRFASVEVQVAAVRLGLPCRRALGLDAGLLSAVALSALTLGGLLAVLSRLAPTPGLNHDERAETARLRLLHTYLEAADQRPAEPSSERDDAARAAASTPRPPRPPAHDPAWAARDVELDAAPLDPALELLDAATPPRDPIQRHQQVVAARKFGVTGMLDWPELNDPSKRFERHLNGEELALMQRLFNPDSPAPLEGPGGLALGVGIGGGGKADVVELGELRTAAEERGGGLERFRAPALDPETRAPRALLARHVESIDSDPLAAASIRRVVDAERAALRDCSRSAPASAPALATSATVRFVVQGDGRIEQVRASHPALPDGVRTCIERVFLGLSVPNPVSRPVHVAYRIALGA